MKLLHAKNWKKTAAVVAAALMLFGSFTLPVMAHGHGSHHSGSTGVYCAYHNKTHKKLSSCSKYCTKHQTIHTNGKVHHTNHH